MSSLLFRLAAVVFSLTVLVQSNVAIAEQEECLESGRLILVAADRSALKGLDGVVRIDDRSFYVDRNLVEVVRTGANTAEIRKKKKKSKNPEDSVIIGSATCDSCGEGGCMMVSNGKEKRCKGDCCRMIVVIRDGPKMSDSPEML